LANERETIDEQQKKWQAEFIAHCRSVEDKETNKRREEREAWEAEEKERRAALVRKWESEFEVKKQKQLSEEANRKKVEACYQ